MFGLGTKKFLPNKQALTGTQEPGLEVEIGPEGRRGPVGGPWEGLELWQLGAAWPWGSSFGGGEEREGRAFLSLGWLSSLVQLGCSANFLAPLRI